MKRKVAGALGDTAIVGNPAEFPQEPAEGDRFEGDFPVDYDEPADGGTETISVVVTTRAFAESGTAADTHCVDTKRLMESRGITGIDAKILSVCLSWVAEDAASSNNVRVRLELSEVAATVLRAVIAKKQIPGNPMSNAGLTAAEDMVRTAYAAPIKGWPQAEVKFLFQAQSGYTLNVTNLQFVSKVTVRVGRGKEEGRSSNEQLNAITGDTALALNRQHDRLFNSQLNGRVPSPAPLRTIVKAVGESKELSGRMEVTTNSTDCKGTADPRPAKPGEVLICADYRWIITTLEAKFDASANLNAEQKITGEGKMDAANLFYLIGTGFRGKGRDSGRRGDLNETHQLSIRGGDEYQRAAYDLNWKRDTKAGEFGASLEMDYTRDINQRYGRREDGAQLEEVGRGLEPKMTYTLQRSTRPKEATDPSRLGWRMVLGGGFPVRHTRLLPRVEQAVAVADGLVVAFAPDLFHALRIDLSRRAKSGPIRPGIGVIDVTLHGEGKLAGSGGDFRFQRFGADVGIASTLGATRGDQFLVRYRRGGGVASAGTPVFEQFRLGGEGNVRGIEAGEFIGRSLAFDQSEFGWNLSEPIGWIAKLAAGKPKQGEAGEAGEAETAAKKSGDPLAALGIPAAFLKIFYDRGTVTGPGTSLGSMFRMQQAAIGRGIAVELQGIQAGAVRVNLTIGYARSSRSYVHKGITITGVSVVF